MHPYSTGPLRVRPAPWTRRFAALLLDYAFLGAVVALIAQVLPEGPPPADSMAFFTTQDFVNYFLLVGLVFVLVNLSFARGRGVEYRGTPAQKLLRLRLRSLNDTEPDRIQVLIRWRKAMMHAFFVTVPGPLIALFIGAFFGAFFNLPFTTADQVLREAGVPQVIRYALHGLSFVALFGALWYFVVKPNVEASEREANGLTSLDKKSGTTLVLKTDA